MVFRPHPGEGRRVSNRHPDETSATLLGKLRAQSDNAAAWSEFIQRYRPRIFGFSIASGLQPADAEDVTQNVLCKLAVKMRDFCYDPNQSFRAWLKAVTRNVLHDFHNERRVNASGESAVLRMLDNVQAREELAQQLEAEFDCELLEEAIRRVRAGAGAPVGRVSPDGTGGAKRRGSGRPVRNARGVRLHGQKPRAEDGPRRDCESGRVIDSGRRAQSHRRFVNGRNPPLSRIHAPAGGASQIRTVKSPPPDTNRRPSGVKATA